MFLVEIKFVTSVKMKLRTNYILYVYALFTGIGETHYLMKFLF